MQAADISSYGKGVIEPMASDLFARIRRLASWPLVKTLVSDMGIMRTLRFLRELQGESKKLGSYDLTHIEAGGFPVEHARVFFDDVTLMRLLWAHLGEERARAAVARLLTETNRRASKIGHNIKMVPLQEICAAEDRFICFKELVKSWELAVQAEGFHRVEIVRDSPDELAFDVTYCVSHEIAKAAGDARYCFPCCHADDVVFPDVGPEIGFEYSRSSTLGEGSTRCDFRFHRA